MCISLNLGVKIYGQGQTCFKRESTHSKKTKESYHIS